MRLAYAPMVLQILSGTSSEASIRKLEQAKKNYALRSPNRYGIWTERLNLSSDSWLI
jgi:hypothetical protein